MNNKSFSVIHKFDQNQTKIVSNKLSQGDKIHLLAHTTEIYTIHILLQ